jgi:hypothetical protein
MSSPTITVPGASAPRRASAVAKNAAAGLARHLRLDARVSWITGRHAMTPQRLTVIVKPTSNHLRQMSTRAAG